MARVFELTTPLGADVLFFRSLSAYEELGRLSEFTLTALSERADIGASELLGKNLTVSVELRSGGSRYFNGYVSRFAPDGTAGRYFQYRLVARPWLWFLTRTADCRIFQDKNVPDILAEVFAKHQVADFDPADLTDIYTPREYCVQYRETDFNFVSRLMEEEGIYYYFEHHDGRHVMRLVDSYSGHKLLEHQPSIAFHPAGHRVRTDEEFIQGWTAAQSIQPGAVALEDYDFTKPKADLGVKAKVIEPHEHADYEVFDYPGEYDETGPGEHYARARIDELHAEFDLAEVRCNVRDIAVGWLFKLTNAPRREQEREYLITRARFELLDNSYETFSGEGTSYHCSFTALQSGQQFRPQRLTPEPRVSGPQTALVVGPRNEEIWCDKYGRIKVQFYWDRYGTKDENSSCWIRVAHPWAGATWGVIFLPRIGQEVVVDFLEGDPDRPIIIGSVYNADEMPPYELPANKTQSGIKTRSSLKGGPSNFNEIRFEDKKGHEQLVIHAEQTMLESVEASQFITVGGNRHITTGYEKDGAKHGDVKELVHNNHNLHVRNDERVAVDGDSSMTVLGSTSISSSGDYSLQGDKGVVISADSITLQGLKSITLMAAGSSIVINAGGVTVLGAPLIQLNSPASVPPTPPVLPPTILPDDP